jgi:signal transduction histidine kinase
VRWRHIFVRADQEKIQRLLINLVGNAIKNSSRDDVVSLIFGATEDEAIIVVSDSGRGIDAEHLDKIFNRFYKIPASHDYNEGTGLGLAICKAIVESIGGQINVQSKIDVGTTFSVSLPLAEPLID